MGFSNMRIGFKLSLTFFAMVLLTLLLGALAARQMGVIHDDMKKNRHPLVA